MGDGWFWTRAWVATRYGELGNQMQLNHLHKKKWFNVKKWVLRASNILLTPEHKQVGCLVVKNFVVSNGNDLSSLQETL